MQDPVGINIEVGLGDTQKSLIHPARDNLSINLFLADIRNAFTRIPRANRDVRIDICVEMAKQSDQLKTSIRVQESDCTEHGREKQEADRDQVLLNCISRCTKQKPLEAAEGLSRLFSGSADSSFERGRDFFPEQYSINQTLSDRMFFLASKETNETNGYSIELFLNYLVKRRRWHRVHICVTAADKTGDLAMIPLSTIHAYGFRMWKPPQSFVRLLESVLQDLDLTGPVTKVYLPLYHHASGNFRYDFEEVQASIDYQQKDLLERIEVDAISRLRGMGCAQYQESQLTTLKRLQPDTFLVTDGSGEYVEHKAPFARTIFEENEFKTFVEDMMKIQKLSDCPGIVKFIGVVLDDHRNHVKGCLLESAFLGLNGVFFWAKLKNYIVPRALRRLWARQLITSISEMHSRGLVVGSLTISISHSLDIRLPNLWGKLRYLPDGEGLRPPELRGVKVQTRECVEFSQKGDIFQLGLFLWTLSEHIPIGRKHFCVMAGCTTRPYYSCHDTQHADPISLRSSQCNDPVLKEIIEKCRMEDPDKRPSAQELAQEITSKSSVEQDEIEISRDKRAFRKAMKSVSEYGYASLMFCDECCLPALSYYYHCNTCFNGNFDLCHSCVESGLHCFDSNHKLIKMRRDLSGNLIQES